MEENNLGQMAKKLLLAIVKNPIIMVPTAIILFVLLIVFILIAIFAADSDNGIYKTDEEDCTAIPITISGTVEGSSTKLNITGDGISFKDIKGKYENGVITAEKKLSKNEQQQLNNDLAAKIWNYFRASGYSEAATAGILGNLGHESAGLHPDIIEGGSGEGIGLAQWSFGRKTKLKSFAKERGKDWTDVNIQLAFLKNEIEKTETTWLSYIKGKGGLKAWKKSTDIDLATERFCYGFERPGIVAMDNRKSYAHKYYNQFKGKLAFGNISLKGTIEKDDITFSGTLGSEEIFAEGSFKDNNIDATGYIGDTEGCEIGDGACGISYPLKNFNKVNVSSTGCVYRNLENSPGYHCGDDYAVSVGTKIYALFDAKVITVQYSETVGYGNMIQLEQIGNTNNGNKLYAIYGHLSEIKVKKGQKVSSGQVIGKTGNTGNSTGAHLHLEINKQEGGANKSTGCPTSLCYKKDGGIKSVLKTLKKTSEKLCDNSNVVSYAKQFVGKKYYFGGQWNGEKPYTPTDCSGFVQGVYKHFGKNLPRTADDQCDDTRYIKKIAGTGKKKGIKPGDLVCYPGHIAIYIGNGEIVHASNSSPYPKGGVKISKMNYQTWTKVVRVK